MLASLYYKENKFFVAASIIGALIGACGMVYMGLRGHSDLMTVRNEVVAILLVVISVCTGLLYMVLDKLEYIIELAEKQDNKEAENQE